MDTVTAKKVIKCDNCKESVDLKKPAKGEAPNDGIQAVLNAGQLGETKEFHFCDEECLRQFLNKRHQRGKASATVTGHQSITFEWS